MEVMGLIAVLVNCALIGLSGHVHRMFPEMSTTQTILLIVALEVMMDNNNYGTINILELFIFVTSNIILTAWYAASSPYRKGSYSRYS